MVKLTKQEIEQRVKKLFKGLLTIDWEGKEYQGRNSKVKVIDPLYGPFYITVNKLLCGQQHKSRTRRFQTKESVDQFIHKKFKGTVYINWDKTSWPLAVKEYVYAIDREFGEYRTKLAGLIQGNRHRERYNMSKAFKPEEFEKEISKIFKGVVTVKDWQGVEYKGRRRTKGKILAHDKDYGEWETTVKGLLRGTGHPERTRVELSQKRKTEIKEINSRVKKIHKGKVKIRWDLVKNYKVQNSKVFAEDRIYGLWKVTVSALLAGQGHKKRAIKKQKLKKKDIDQNIRNIFEGKVRINWKKSGKYQSNSQKVIAIHKELGEWPTRVQSLLAGHNHPELFFTVSKGEKELTKWLKSLKIKVETRKHLKTENSFREIDIFLPDYNIGIEYNGVYYHCELRKSKKYHLEKRELCENHGITLFQILETEWVYNKKVTKKSILKMLNLTKTITPIIPEIKPVAIQKANLFIKNNSLIPFHNKRYLGYHNNNKLIALIEYHIRKHKLIISNFVTQNQNIIPKALDHLIKHLRTNKQINEVTIILDLRLDSPKQLLKKGFKIQKISIGHLWTNFSKLLTLKPQDINTKNKCRIFDSGQAKLVKLLK